jgi:hypothetical protein
MKSLKPRPLLLALGGLLALTACTPKRVLVMNPISPAYVDDSTGEPRILKSESLRVLLVPPDGDAAADFEEHFATLDTTLARHGVSLILPAESTPAGDVDSALRLARASGADAVMSVIGWQWMRSGEVDEGRRYFVDIRGDTLAEVDQATYEAAGRKKVRYWYGTRVLDFTARLLRPEDGKETARLHIRVPRVRVADPFMAVFKKNGGDLLTESYSWSYDDERNAVTIERAVAVLGDRVGELLRGR